MVLQSILDTSVGSVRKWLLGYDFMEYQTVGMLIYLSFTSQKECGTVAFTLITSFSVHPSVVA